MRDAETYRGARRLVSTKVMEYYSKPAVIQKSFLSKRPSKYMPHTSGNGFVPNLSYPKASLNAAATAEAMLARGLPIPRILSNREMHNNKRQRNTKRRMWKAKRRSGLH